MVGTCITMPTYVASQDMEFDEKNKEPVNYYRFSDDYIPPVCTGRAPCYAALLNDEFVSIAHGRDGFMHMRRTQYEIAMFVCEDDRYELDMLIQHTLSTIRLIRTQLHLISSLKAKGKDVDADSPSRKDKDKESEGVKNLDNRPDSSGDTWMEGKEGQEGKEGKEGKEAKRSALVVQLSLCSIEQLVGLFGGQARNQQALDNVVHDVVAALQHHSASVTTSACSCAAAMVWHSRCVKVCRPLLPLYYTGLF